MADSGFFILDNLNFLAYHGTTLDKASCIVESGFEVNPSEEDWLGNGVYFFVDGFACPKVNAMEWASFKSHGLQPCVVVSEVSVPLEKVLDLRSEKGLHAYNQEKSHFITSHYRSLLTRRDLVKKKRRDIRLDDAVITKGVLLSLGVSVLFHNLYIKRKVHRDLELESSYPNSTVCCVADPAYILRSWIELI